MIIKKEELILDVKRKSNLSCDQCVSSVQKSKALLQYKMYHEFSNKKTLLSSGLMICPSYFHPA